MQQQTLDFLSQLEQNNNKPWFDKHKLEYEAAKEDFENLTQELLQELTPLETALAELKPKDCIFRIYRDVRFAKDKRPYKAHFGAFLSKGGRKYEGAGYYIHIEPNKSFAGGGLWMPQSPLLKNVRQEIDYNLSEFENIISNKDFKKYFGKPEGEKLKTVPQGYDTDNPAIEYLKMKSYTVGCSLADKEVTAKNFTSKCVKIFTVMKPFVDFLNRPLTEV